MSINWKLYFLKMVKNPPTSIEVIQKVKGSVDFNFPPDYLSLFLEFDGGEGEIGKNSWLEIFPIENVVSLNSDYHFLMEQIPDYLLIGKDAADTGYAFHKVNHTFHSFGLMSDFKFDSIHNCGSDFIDFLEYLFQADQ